jgi:hypothetical protein
MVRLSFTKLAVSRAASCVDNQSRGLMEKSAKQIIRELLTSEALKPPKHMNCPKCGSVMQHAVTRFTFGDGGESWVLPLPVCVNCDLQRNRKG